MSDQSPRMQPPAPDMIRFRDLLAASYGQHPPLHTLSIQAARAVAEIVRAPWASGGPAMHDTRNHVVESGGLSLRLRVHRPKETPDGVLVYVHGGGWTLFSMDTHDRVMREYAGRAGFAVVGIDYTLVPEAVFPRQVDEVTALVRLLRQPDAPAWLGFDPFGLPTAIGGDSAGGNLAMAAALTLRDAGEIDRLQAIILNYAVTDSDETRPSYRIYGGPDYNLTEEEMRGFWDGYALDPAVRQDPRAALLRGTLNDLPPTYLAIAECDVLRDENLALAAALQKAGVSVRSQIYPGMLHSFLEAVSISPTSARAFQETAAWLRATFGLDRAR
jgi:acetyl esterase